jgi:hypothetical protein
MNISPEGGLSVTEALLISDINNAYATAAAADELGIVGHDITPDSETDPPTQLELAGLARLSEAVRVVRMTRILGKAGTVTFIKHSPLGSDDTSGMVAGETIGAVLPDEQMRRADDAEVEEVRALLSQTEWVPTLTAEAAKPQN